MNTKNPLFEGGQGGLNLFIIGASGCGKSTQAQLVADKYHLQHLSMGELLRQEIDSGSDLGLKAKGFVDQGMPVPDEITIPILLSALNKIANQNFIVDGFPRLLEQGQSVDAYLEKVNHPTCLVIHLLVDFLEIVKRRQKLGENFQDQNRTDNTPEAIANRQKILYEKEINPILGYYRSHGKLFEVDGNRPVEPIFNDICQKIDTLI